MNTPDARLSPRQRGMLEAMGIKLWWPEPRPQAVAAPPPRPAPPQDALDMPPATAAATPPRRKAAAENVPPPVAPAVPASQAGTEVWLDTPQHLYGPQDPGHQGGWLVVADLAPQGEGTQAIHAAADARRLLDNMLRALGLHEGQVPVHLLCAHRGSASATASPRAAQPWADALATHIPALAPRIVLALGPLSAQGLLGREAPIGRLRGRREPAAAFPQVQVVASYHLDYLLRNGSDKAKAWADLCQAAQFFENGE